MNTIQIHSEQEFRIYGEILHSRLQPFKPQFNDRELLSELIEYANTREIVINIAEHDLNKFLNSIDYNWLGYRGPNDYIANIRSGNKPETAVIQIVPDKHYLLGDMMENDIEKPPCFKSKCYLRLIIDEFERIKIRACCLLNSVEDVDQLKLLALKILRIAEYLLRETSAFCHYLLIPEDDNHKHSLYYINDCLKKFIIKSIRFYYRLFDPYITEYCGQSKKLINNIDRATSSDCIKYIYQDNFDQYLEEPISKEGSQINKNTSSPIIQWNEKINLLTSLFYDLLEKGVISIHDSKNPNKNSKVSEASKQSETNMKLVKILYDNFLDNNGKRLSKDTLRTYLNPNRPDKRSKKSQNLDIEKYI